MTRDEFVSKNEICGVLEANGVNVIGAGSQRMAKCPFHEDGSASFSINVDNQVWKCHAGCGGGSVIDLIAKLENINAVDVLKREGINSGKSEPYKSRPKAAPEPTGPPVKSEIEKIYQYKNEQGADVYQVVRFKPKTFRQRHVKNGAWEWNMNGVTRVLYRLPEVQKAKTVFVVEGERDSDSLTALGYTATCNVGGAGKWLDAYTESLAGKDVILCGDNDEPGRKHITMVFESIAGKVNSSRTITIPSPFKDVSDFIESADSPEFSKSVIDNLIEQSQIFYKGYKVEVYSIAELEEKYRKFVRNISETSFDLGKWMPCFKWERPLVPGDLVLIVGATGVGKTNILLNIAKAARPLPTVFFENELPAISLYERMIAMDRKIPSREVEETYRGSDDAFGKVLLDKVFKGLYISERSGLSVDDLEKEIERSELKIGEPPKLILLDYFQLLKGAGKRYERASDNAEQLKVVAKRRNVIIIIASQISRPPADREGNNEITLHDAKDSGCLSQETTNLLTESGFQENMLCKMDTYTLRTNGKVTSLTSSGIDSGKKECIRVRLRSGRYLDCTPEHKILTDKGWLEAFKITPEHAVAVARNITSPKSVRGVPQARFMGWMIGDGCSLYSVASFTCADPNLSGDFIKEVKSLFGLNIKRRKLAAHMTHDEFYLSRGSSSMAVNPVTAFLKDSGMWGLKSFEKRIPEWFLRNADNNSIAEIVGGLIDTDGCVRKSDRGRVNIKFSTTSEGLAWDFLFCLMRLGIFGRFQLPEIKKNTNISKAGKVIISKRAGYTILIDSSKDVEKFSKIIKLTQRKQLRLIGFKQSKRHSNLGDNLGDWVWKRIAEHARKEGLGDRKYMMARCQDRRISHERLREELSHFKQPPKDLLPLVNENIYWDKLCTKKMIGRRKVFDRSVNPKEPNFVANGIIVHNSLENSSGLVIGAWRDKEDMQTMYVRVLKNTKRFAWKEPVACDYLGDRSIIRQKALESEDQLRIDVGAV